MNAPIATLENKNPSLPAEISTAYAAGDFSHMTLPGWTYSNAEFFELEKEYLFLSNWMLVCHVSEVPNPGDFATLRLMGERALVIRGEDGDLARLLQCLPASRLCRRAGPHRQPVLPPASVAPITAGSMAWTAA